MNAVKRVLLADCEEIFREELRRAIDASGTMQVVGEAADGVEALKLLASLQPDVIVMDLQLPYVAGIQVLEQAAQISPRTACIILSTFAGTEIVAEATAWGARDFICKPCNFNWLAERITLLLQPKQCGPARRNVRLLQILHIPNHLEGFHCLAEGLDICLTNREALQSVTKWLYPEIARRRNTNWQAVEKAMRGCIKLAWERGMPEVLESRFGRKLPHRPSVREFMELLIGLINEIESNGREAI